MKHATTKKNFTCMSFILLFCGMFSAAGVKAQTCTGNKVWACRVDACNIEECKCVSANGVQNWMATIPACNDYNSWIHCCHGMVWRIGQDLSNMPVQISPNPASTFATVSFYLSADQKVSIHVLDMEGRMVLTLTEQHFEKGINEWAWNSIQVTSGIYFLQLQSEEINETIKIAVTQ
jgi:hypothetical protein